MMNPAPVIHMLIFAPKISLYWTVVSARAFMQRYKYPVDRLEIPCLDELFPRRFVIRSQICHRAVPSHFVLFSVIAVVISIFTNCRYRDATHLLLSMRLTMQICRNGVTPVEFGHLGQRFVQYDVEPS